MKPKCYICYILDWECVGEIKVAFHGDEVWLCGDCFNTYKDFIDGNAKRLPESNVFGNNG